MWKHLPFPGGLILLAVAGAQAWPPARAVIEPYLSLFYYLILIAGLALAWLYNRGRTVVALLLLALAAWALPATIAATHANAMRLQLLTLLLPLNLLLLALLPERGVRAPSTMLGLGLVAAQAAGWLQVHRLDAENITKLLAIPLVPPAWSQWTWIGHPASFAFALALVTPAALFFWRRRPADRALFWAVAAAFLAVHAAHDGTLATLYFGAAALLLGLAVLEHAHSVAYVDELTGVPGRRALNEFLPQVLGRVAVAMVDVDHFKKFNDTYGHDAGDQVLRLVARRLAAVAAGGRAFRYGGEEFTVVFPGLSKKEALPFLEALRASIEETGFRVRGTKRPKKKPRERRSAPRGAKTVSVTVSIGVAERGADLSTLAQVIAAADRALYRAKEGGRNQVRLD